MNIPSFRDHTYSHDEIDRIESAFDISIWNAPFWLGPSEVSALEPEEAQQHASDRLDRWLEARYPDAPVSARNLLRRGLRQWIEMQRSEPTL